MSREGEDKDIEEKGNSARERRGLGSGALGLKEEERSLGLSL